MKIKATAFLMISIFVLPAIAGEPASSKPLPLIENGYAGFLCGELDLEPASEKLVDQAVDKIKVGTSGHLYDKKLAKRVAKAYAYRDRGHGGDCLANVQGEYWEPKNQPK